MTLHQVQRVRFETRRRLLTVTQIERITPKMLRIHLTCPDMEGFASPSPDDHVKLFLKTDDANSGPVPGYHMRDYTPRYFDVDAGTIVLDFAVHEAGPATAWALGAQPGSTVEIGGPRGSAVVPDDYDWYLLIGDETALPAIGRRVENLRAGVPVITMGLIDDAAERQSFETQADWSAIWVERAGQDLDDGALITRALSDLKLPEGEGFIWIATEAQAAKTARTYVLDTMGHNKSWLKASGYWQAGEPGAHASLDDEGGKH